MPTRTSFAITADDRPVSLGSEGAGEITFTVSNTTTRAIRGQARLVPLGETRRDWLQIRGEVERDFSADEVHQFVVGMNVPNDAPAGRYRFRLNMVSVQNPDDDYTEGPTVAFEWGGAAVSPPKKKPFPWFIVILVLVVLGGGTAIWQLLSGNGSDEIAVPELVGLQRSEAEGQLQETNLTLGEVTRRQVWAPLDEVIDQSPTNGAMVAEGEPINLVLADSTFRFRSTRSVRQPDQTMTVTAQYRVTWERRNTEGSIGEFELEETQLQVQGDEDESALEAVLARLRRTDGDVSVTESNTLVISKWDAYEVYTNQLSRAVEGSDSDEESDERSTDAQLGKFGETIYASIARLEVNFDLAAIFTMSVTNAEVGVSNFTLQPGKGSMITPIKIQGEEASERVGAESHTYSVVRRAEENQPFEKIGTATYRTDDGLLEELDVTINRGDMTLRIRIEGE